MKYGFKNATKVHLSQKRTCGRVDRGAGVYGGCYAFLDPNHIYPNGFCSLGFDCKDHKPLQPCYKPTTESQLVYCLKLLGKVT
jgi:hypothetical protein